MQPGWGGDEFVIILEESGSTEEITTLCERLIEKISRPTTIDSIMVTTTVSIGISIYPSDGSDAETLLRNADISMYQSKKEGRNRLTFFNPDMLLDIAYRHQLEHDLRIALHQNLFYLEYQPKIDISKNRIVGLESRVRWNHPERGLISPDNFIPAAERSGLILPLGKWILEKAAGFACEIEKRYPGCGLRISVNISFIQIKETSFSDDILETLERAGCPPELIDLEITETGLMENQEASALHLNRLKEHGVSISLDDFGTGYSSMNYLRILPVDAIKVDRSFIENIPQGEESSEMVRAIIALGRALSREVVAEGVENEEQIQFLKEVGCEVVQGYYYSKPLPEEEALNFINKYLLK